MLELVKATAIADNVYRRALVRRRRRSVGGWLLVAKLSGQWATTTTFKVEMLGVEYLMQARITGDHSDELQLFSFCVGDLIKHRTAREDRSMILRRFRAAWLLSC